MNDVIKILTSKIFIALLAAYVVNQSTSRACYKPLFPNISTEKSLLWFRYHWRSRVGELMATGGYTKEEIEELFGMQGRDITAITSSQQGVYTGKALGKYTIDTAQNYGLMLPVVIIPLPKKRPGMQLDFPLDPAFLDYMEKRYAEQNKKDSKLQNQG